MSASLPSVRVLPTVLVVDDEPLVARALLRLLRRSFDVLTATTPEEALEVVDLNDVAVVLSDQRMPGMDGAELLSLIRRRDPRVMGLIITAYADIDAVAAAINQAGVVGYLRKPWRDEDVVEAVERAVAAHSDAGARARERAELVKQENAVRILVDHAPIGVAVLGPAPQLVLVRCNAPFSELTSASADSLCGSALSQLVGGQASEALHALCLRAERTSEVLTAAELEWVTGAGTVRHVTCTVSSLGSGFESGPGRQGFVLTAADISETVATREEARRLATLQAAILEQLPNGVIVVDAAGRTLVRNNSARRLQPDLTHLSIAESPLAPAETDPDHSPGKNQAHSMPTDWSPRHPDSGQRLRPHELPLARALTGERVVDLEYRQDRPHDGLAWIRASAAPLLNEQGHITGAVTVFADITADHIAEQARSVALASASHELRTPLTSALGFATILLSGEMGPLSDQQIKAVTRIKGSAERLHLLIEDIMDLTTIEAGATDLHPAVVDIGSLLARMVGSFAPQTQAKGQQLLLDRPPAPMHVWADERRLEQVVANLISNAHKYTLEAGRILVSVSQDADATRVTVEDNGVGLTAEEVGKLYTKFYRARNKATWDVPGTGLGLAITRALVERQGGSMLIDSTPGKGSVFGFTLPISR